MTSDLSNSFNSQSILFVNFFFQLFYFSFDIIFVVDFDYPFLQFLLELHLFFFDFVP